ncbi:GNAT family N-acetyltransferase [Streptomyces sp. H27-H1]|uniref:GNAT family N-acetyltransferase n=1 Tax=Streptomyces sp. H27-H1 TaxID=2996461 RepID=UPI00226E5F6E|nr:GNAT family N-acetyltransferase [Streptomyces sp. H27-H1]MCY0932554.1 GNAT family N-acetyltransferase [Streptomyces sp. H27-H1]
MRRRWGRTRVRRRDWERLLTLSECWVAAEGLVVVGLVSAGRVHNEPATVDLGLQVADQRHRRGIGTQLIRTAAGRAHAAGAYTMHAYVARSNNPMLALLRQLGPTAERPDGAHLEVRLPLALLALPAAHPSVRQDCHAHPQRPDRNR